MSNEQILEQLTIAVKGIEDIKQSNEDMKADIAQTKDDIKAMKADIAQTKDDINELKLSVGKLDEKVNGIDTRLANEETISRNALGIVAGGTMLAVFKYLFFPG